MTVCKTISASKIASPFRKHVKNVILKERIKPKLVGLLANNDPGACKYAEWTSKVCKETGIDFELRKIDKHSINDHIEKANMDQQINGIMVYYPVFGHEVDNQLQNKISPLKDVEGLGQILEYTGKYNTRLPYCERLKGTNVAIVNRSKIAGSPLAAILANEGANVFSVDINDIQVFQKPDDRNHCSVRNTQLKYDQAISSSDIVITGVPSSDFKLSSALLKPGVTAINFSMNSNFDSDVKSKAGCYVPSIGQVTVAMLVRNALRLYHYQRKQMDLTK
ncbi:Methylenetetrahydrofolate dehydrogenase [NAD(+)] [Choanephora cucurbitarum]|uniref:Methylenetetrahydrofolate dehydrogenase [NAD(+)] n=1 Tax=Choanephora cucurbitarum TaxID=101091 RepID=A0A1C7NBR1_9FUNG|nr:Methylenetetrahydrofolate dehydrogenase [NAD(+)] [Choanephora cucurbitarum]